MKKFFQELNTKRVASLVIGVGLLVYFNSLFNGFFGDDIPQIVQNPMVRSVENIPAFFTGGTFYNAGDKLAGVYFRPVVSTVSTLIYNTSCVAAIQ